MSKIKVNDDTITLENYKKMEAIGNGPNGHVYKIKHMKTKKNMCSKGVNIQHERPNKKL